MVLYQTHSGQWFDSKKANSEEESFTSTKNGSEITNLI